MLVGRVGEDVTRILRGCYEETVVVEFRLYAFNINKLLVSVV